MRRILGVLAICACGGASPPPAKPMAPTASKPSPVPREAAVTPAPKEQEPVILHAKAEMTPTKGSKLEPFVIAFMQRQGDNALVLADLPVGVKAGTYHYVIHEGSECAKPGPTWAETKDVDLRLVVLEDLTGALDNTELAAHLEGEQTLIGHTLVLHDDKKGKPGKALACAPIVASDE